MTTTRLVIPDAAVEAVTDILEDVIEWEEPEAAEDIALAVVRAAYPAIRQQILAEVADFALKEYTETRKDRIFAESLAYHLTIKGIDAVTEADDDDQ